MPDESDATVTITAERIDGKWTFWAMPDSTHSNSERLMLGSGVVGSGVLFPTAVVDQFWQGMQA